MSQQFRFFILIVGSAIAALSAPPAFASEASYRLTVVNEWTVADFPANYCFGTTEG